MYTYIYIHFLSICCIQGVQYIVNIYIYACIHACKWIKRVGGIFKAAVQAHSHFMYAIRNCVVGAKHDQ